MRSFREIDVDDTGLAKAITVKTVRTGNSTVRLLFTHRCLKYMLCSQCCVLSSTNPQI